MRSFLLIAAVAVTASCSHTKPQPAVALTLDDGTTFTDQELRQCVDPCQANNDFNVGDCKITRSNERFECREQCDRRLVGCQDRSDSSLARQACVFGHVSCYDACNEATAVLWEACDHRRQDCLANCAARK